MAKKSSIENNKRRAKLAKAYAGRRARLKAKANDEALDGGRAVRGAPQARRVAAQFRRDSRIATAARCRGVRAPSIAS